MHHSSIRHNVGYDRTLDRRKSLESFNFILEAKGFEIFCLERLGTQTDAFRAVTQSPYAYSVLAASTFPPESAQRQVYTPPGGNAGKACRTAVVRICLPYMYFPAHPSKKGAG